MDYGLLNKINNQNGIHDIYSSMNLWTKICDHKDPTTGDSALIPDPDNKTTCSICKDTFRLSDGERFTNTLNNILNDFKHKKLYSRNYNLL